MLNFIAVGFDFNLTDWFWSLLSALFDLLLGLLPDGPSASVQSINASMGPLVKYLGWLSGIDYAFTAVISAYVVRFLIRRLPVVG